MIVLPIAEIVDTLSEYTGPAAGLAPSITFCDVNKIPDDSCARGMS